MASDKYDSITAGNPQCLYNPLSQFERQTFHTMKQMCHASAYENGFVMSQDEAYNLIKETYSGSRQVTEDFNITNWQVASHLSHGKGVNINPKDFVITQAELIKIQNEGICTDGKQITFYRACKSLSKSIEGYFLDPSTDRRGDSEYYNLDGITPTTAFKNDRYLVSFNQTTRDLITNDKQDWQQKWIDKWSK